MRKSKLLTEKLQLNEYNYNKNGLAIRNGEVVGCSIDVTDITIPDSVTSIGSNAFYGCGSLTNITIPNSVTLIESCAFADCRNLTSIIIPDSVARIPYGAFYGCVSLKSITIPDSVISIGRSAFDYCYDLKDIYYSGSHTDWEKINIENYNDKLLDANIHYENSGYSWLDDMVLDESQQEQQLVSNGIYSVLKDKWIKEPVEQDIPEIDQEAFSKLFNIWKDRYDELLAQISKEVSYEEEKI